MINRPVPATDTGDVAVAIRDLTAAYDREPVLAGVDLDLPAARLITVLGPNGAGKSTLLRILAGTLAPLHGEILVHGQPVEAERRKSRIAYMPQQEQLDWDFPLAVRDVVLSGRYGHIRRQGGWRRFLPPSLIRGEHEAAVKKALQDTDMLERQHVPIDRLSGGQRKRVLLARALVQQADLLLLDEPLAGVDSASEELIMRVLRRTRDQGHTVLMVTHDVMGARKSADHVVLINRQVVGQGPPDAMLSDEMLARVATINWIKPVARERSLSSVDGPAASPRER
ncbi:metal ABC transporter ATP-binding protein [Methylonatrum kenyense]|nr:metal ABC transporter ATP-binding protein [Methylonatrum kenyense]MCK8514784.1 metal ABC transporter ATP-binding protein [Methylonatrum kenyense]